MQPNAQNHLCAVILVHRESLRCGLIYCNTRQEKREMKCCQSLQVKKTFLINAYEIVRPETTETKNDFQGCQFL